MRRTAEELERGIAHVRLSPSEHGTLDLIVRGPAVDEREVLDEAFLDLGEGLLGDSWRVRGNPRTADGEADPESQLNVMNARAAALVAGPMHRWCLAGDQLLVDFDLSTTATPGGTRLCIGAAVIEITAKPHRGCVKFAERFGADALRFVNGRAGVELNLRGRNARVVSAGAVRVGDEVTRLTDG